MAKREKKVSNHIPKSVYVSGSTATKLQAAPARKPDNYESPKRRHDADYERREQERREQLKRQQKINNASHKNLLYTATVTGIVVLIFIACLQYLHLQATVKTSASEISKLQSQLNDLKERNDELEVQVNANIDYDELYRIATEELGMVYPEKKQIIQYDSGISEYVKQYGDIPAAD